MTLKDSPLVTTKNQKFQDWLSGNQDMPGACLVDLVQQHLHNSQTANDTRLNLCHCAKNHPICFDQFHGGLEKCTTMPLSHISVHDARCFGYPQSGHLVHSLGTETVCLPLLLAGAAVQNVGIVLELDPFVGMSSCCIGLGLNATSSQNSLYSFDLFWNEANYKTISQNMNWIHSYKPDFWEDSSFLCLW